MSLEPWFGSFTCRWPVSEWSTSLGGGAPESVTPWCDEYVLEALHCQILGPGHLARLGGAPAGASPLAGGRLAVTIGESTFLDSRLTRWCMWADTQADSQGNIYFAPLTTAPSDSGCPPPPDPEYD